MSRTPRRTLDALVGYINKALGYSPNAGRWVPAKGRVPGFCERGYCIEANSPGDGKTRYCLHFYSGKGSGVAHVPSWSYSVGASEFEGRLRAFLAGIDAEGWGNAADKR